MRSATIIIGKILVFVVCILFFTNCNKSDIDETPDFMDIVNFDDIVCLNPNVDWNSIELFSNLKVVVKSQLAYSNLINSFYSESTCGCSNFCEADVDFTKYSLLACASYGYSSIAEYEREVIKNTNTKQITYRITVSYTNDGTDAKNQFSLNWARIPKLENDYTVKFEAVEELSYEEE